MKSFAEPLKLMAQSFVEATGDNSWTIEKGTVVGAGLGLDKTYRHVLQTLGTEWGRKCIHPDVWIKIAMREVDEYPDQSFVFDDVRFLNEATAIWERGGEVWRIMRDNVEVDEKVVLHSSEKGLDGCLFDRLITNNSTPLQFHASLEWTALLPSLGRSAKPQGMLDGLYPSAPPPEAYQKGRRSR